MVPMFTYHEASVIDIPSLRVLAHKSEAHWGGSDAFMDEFDRSFNITEEFLKNNPVFLMKDPDGDIVAFWGLIFLPEKTTESGKVWAELEYFYVDVTELGYGHGRKLWHHMTEWAFKHQISRIHLVTSPEALGFYDRMGAVQIGEVPSSIDGRMIPELLYLL